MRRTLTKLCVLALVVTALHAVINHNRIDFELAERLDRYLETGVDALLLGDSVVHRHAVADVDTRNVIDMVADGVAPRRLGAISHPAYSARMYEHYVNYMLGRNGKWPATLLVEISLLSFSVLREERPEYQFPRETILLRAGNPYLLRLFYHSINALKGFPRAGLSPAAFAAQPVFKGRAFAGTVRDYDGLGAVAYGPGELERSAVAKYGAEISSDQTLLAALKRITISGKRRGLRVILFLTPLDHERLVALAGTWLGDQIASNIKTITGVLADAGGQVLDTSHLLRSAEFENHNGIDEHLTDIGRRTLSLRLVEALKDSAASSGQGS